MSVVSQLSTASTRALPDDDDMSTVAAEEELEEPGLQAVLRHRAPPAPEVAGKSSVMPSVMAAARGAASNVAEASALLGEASAAVMAHEAHSAFVRASAASAAAVAPASAAATSAASAASSASSALASRHRSAVAKSADVGRSVGASVGQGLAALIVAIARRLGAHRCDQCGREGLYDYMVCQAAECQRDRVAVGGVVLAEAGYDLCYPCHQSWARGSGLTFHPASHTFREHKNGVYAIKLLGLIVAVLIVMRWMINKIV